MLLEFTLSMPSVNSWDGKWSGREKRYAIYRSFTSAKGKANAAVILAKGYYHYSFGDGWAAGVSVKQAPKRLKSDGFCGYDWMVDSIINYGKIMNDIQISDMHAKKESANV